MRRFRTERRRGVAVVEFAFVAPLLFILLLGLWEVGRLIQLQQTLSNAAREGARIAAQGLTINSTGSPTLIKVNTGSPNVKTTIFNYLKQNGFASISLSDLNVTFQFLDGDTSKTDPYQGTKGQMFRVSLTVPAASLQWTVLGPIQPATLSASVVWFCLVDDEFTLDPTLPNW
jgi:Flp pilus assembly protein TadG